MKFSIFRSSFDNFTYMDDNPWILRKAEKKFFLVAERPLLVAGPLKKNFFCGFPYAQYKNYEH